MSTKQNTANNRSKDHMYLLDTCEYKEIFKDSQHAISEVLGSTKTSQHLLLECTNCITKDKQIDIYSHCESIKRIKIVLTAYNKLREHNDLWRNVSLLPILTLKDIYTFTQINNDFIHIKDHINDDEKIEKELHSKFKAEFIECSALDKCNEYGRWRYNAKYKYPEWLNNEDIVFQEECDKIYSYLIHSGFDDVGKEINYPQNGNIPKNNKMYIGHKQDEEWWNYKIDEMDESIYGQLVENMGIFRWQRPHGFTSKQHHGLMHLKPKYKNIKEEILYNPYYRLSTDAWNQTLRKATVFFKSFARQRIKTWDDGQYNDQITQQISKWQKGEIIDKQEIVILKSYTDFDKLQYELKKCFRFETISDIFTLKDFNPNSTNICYSDVNAKNLRFKLEERLQTFYWWRIGLLTVLNKYGQALNNKISLYHGVNGKMIINRSIEILGFCGPLSTSSSYHVARTFATAKGMVLEIGTQYPRLAVCRGFDASLISDYPEEKEWLIAFSYLTIKTVLTRPLNKAWRSFNDIDNEENHCNIALSSKTRSIFFAIHLFRYQIFSMSPHLEYWLVAFLYLHCKYNEENDRYIKKTKFVKILEKSIIDRKYQDNIDSDRQYRILNILWKKFEKFRKYPTKNQTVKIDEISDNLKPYFLDYDGKDIRKNAKYIVSFSKIIKIFENVQEIHFINNYVFDNIALNKLIKYVDKNPNHKLKKIKFVYYDKISLYSMDQTLLNRLNRNKWEIKHKNMGNIGYQIQLSLINTDSKQTQNHLKSNQFEDNMNNYNLKEAKLSEMFKMNVE